MDLELQIQNLHFLANCANADSNYIKIFNSFVAFYLTNQTTYTK